MKFRQALTVSKKGEAKASDFNPDYAIGIVMRVESTIKTDYRWGGIDKFPQVFSLKT
jgi:hypothetical protein